MNQGSVVVNVTSSLTGQVVAGTSAWSNNTLTFTPAGRWSYGGTYTIHASSQDANGVSLPAIVQTFSTPPIFVGYPVPLSVNNPEAITPAPDGSLWFTLTNNAIGRITPTGNITEFNMATLTSYSGSPNGIVAGPDGNLWFTGTGPYVGSITPSGQISIYAVGSSGNGITVGADGNLWFLETSGRIGRITTGGLFTDFPSSVSTSLYSIPWGIALGSDGNLWFAGQTSIGQLLPSRLP